MSVKKEGLATLAVTAGGSWAETLVGAYMKLGASWVTEEHALARASVCDTCPKLGTVPIPGTKERVTGCTACGCFMSVKPRIWRYFDGTKLRVRKADCPDNKWSEIDRIFKP